MANRLIGSIWSFNPRPRVEGDVSGFVLQKLGILFQSAPSRGGR